MDGEGVVKPQAGHGGKMGLLFGLLRRAARGRFGMCRRGIGMRMLLKLTWEMNGFGWMYLLIVRYPVHHVELAYLVFLVAQRQRNSAAVLLSQALMLELSFLVLLACCKVYVESDFLQDQVAREIARHIRSPIQRQPKELQIFS